MRRCTERTPRRWDRRGDPATSRTPQLLPARRDRHLAQRLGAGLRCAGARPAPLAPGEGCGAVRSCAGAARGVGSSRLYLRRGVRWQRFAGRHGRGFAERSLPPATFSLGEGALGARSGLGALETLRAGEGNPVVAPRCSRPLSGHEETCVPNFQVVE